MSSLGRTNFRAAPRAFGDTGNNLDSHVKAIASMVSKSLRDPETIKLARKLITARYDYMRDPTTGQQIPVVEAWGQFYRAPAGRPCKARDAECEITRVWDFTVLNMRYTFDPAEVDTFSTVKESLESGGGDCDDSTILIASLLKAVGFTVVARVISTTGKHWEHIYPIVGVPHENPSKWVSLDCTVENFKPGDEFKPYKSHRDFAL